VEDKKTAYLMRDLGGKLNHRFKKELCAQERERKKDRLPKAGNGALFLGSVEGNKHRRVKEKDKEVFPKGGRTQTEKGGKSAYRREKMEGRKGVLRGWGGQFRPANNTLVIEEKTWTKKSYQSGGKRLS